jgi:hypothetical protein
MKSTDAKSRNDNPLMRLVNGAAVLAIGLIFWFDHLGKIDAGDFLRWWPLLLIATGLAHLVERRWVSALVLTAIGIAFLPDIPFFPHFRVSEILGLWPILITAAGVTLVMQAIRPAAKDAASSRAGTFRAIGVMGGSARTVSGDPFVGGDAFAVMGAADVTISSASAVSGAVIDVLAFWGGVEIKVPRGWNVESRVTPILGAFVNNTAAATSADAPHVLVRGSAIMGGVEINHPKEEVV